VVTPPPLLHKVTRTACFSTREKHNYRVQPHCLTAWPRDLCMGGPAIVLLHTYSKKTTAGSLSGYAACLHPESQNIFFRIWSKPTTGYASLTVFRKCDMPPSSMQHSFIRIGSTTLPENTPYIHPDMQHTFIRLCNILSSDFVAHTQNTFLRTCSISSYAAYFYPDMQHIFN
jgi:hypothetical protein